MNTLPDIDSNERSESNERLQKQGLMEKIGKATRGLSLALLVSGCAVPLSQVQPTESPEATRKAEALVGKTFKCLAIGGKTPEQAARTYFAMETGVMPEAVKMQLSIVSGPTGPLGTTVVRVERMAVASDMAMEKVQAMVGKTFKCLAIGGKSPEEAARTYFTMESGLSPEAAGVRLVVVRPPEGPLRTTVVKTEWRIEEENLPIEIATKDQEDAMREKLNDILEKCYDNTLRGNRAAKGKMALKLVINPNGSVSTVEFIKASDAFHHAEFEKAVLGHVAKWKFATQKQEVYVVQPISIASIAR